MKETEQQEWKNIELKEVKSSLKKLHKRKSLGLRKLRNFWLNILTTKHKVLTHTLLQTTKIPEEIPKWLAKGITYLLPKKSEPNNPKNYMHVYKLLTSIITKRTYSFLEHCYQPNRKDAERDHTNVKTSYLLAECLLKTATRKNEKAFDKVAHFWILKALDIY